MIVRQYHIVYQEGEEYFLNEPFEWHSGPVHYEDAVKDVEFMNRVWTGKRVYLVVYEIQDMKLA